MVQVLSLAAGRRSKFVVLAVSLVVLLGLAVLGGRLADVTSNAVADSLPSGSESLAVLRAEEGFPSSRVLPAVVVYRREAGPTGADRVAIAKDERALGQADLQVVGPVTGPELSKDGKAALLFVPLVNTGDDAQITTEVKEIRSTVSDGPQGLERKVTGAAAFSADISTVFDGLDVKLLLFTALLVLVLLVVIYRSPIFWLIPFVTVFLAEAATRGAGYLLGSAGLNISDATSGIMSVLIFGAGTDYALLLVSRYRGELHRHEDKHVAMRTALGTGGPAIVASGCTVALALLALFVAEVGDTKALGPLSAAGVLIAMLASLTFLPALLLVAGRRAFWPFIPRVGATDDPATRGVFRRIGARLVRRPRAVWIATAVALVVASFGVATLTTTQTQNGQFTTKVESIEGQDLLAQSFPAGASQTTSIFLPGADRAGAGRFATQLETKSELVASAGDVRTGPDGALVQATLTEDPFSPEAAASIPALREAARAIEPGALVGGETAQSYDLNHAASRDNKVVPPLVLLIVLAILILLLRALTGSLILIATVVLSYLATLGISAVVFDVVFGFSNTDPAVPLLGFVFLVALGIDYNIFLMARVREEAFAHGTREGMLRGLAATGSVITSAGIVLAGTFTLLGILPLVTLAELGFIVAFGVLLDTFLVRSILVPALVFDTDRRFWWPSSLGRKPTPEPLEMHTGEPDAAHATGGA